MVGGSSRRESEIQDREIYHRKSAYYQKDKMRKEIERDKE